MKKLWLHTVRIYLSVGLFFYYKKIKVVKEASIPKNTPILFMSNHQNALIDALLIATTSGRFSYFLTRAAVFKKAFVSKLLHSVNMLPVYRVRDGWSTITKNNFIFKTCTEKLKNNQSVALFPEGSHHINRTVRPLSKGFTRIVFEALNIHPNLDLQMVPIGLNFKEGTTFGDSVSIYYGEPIAAKSMVKEFLNKAALSAMQEFLTIFKKYHINTSITSGEDFITLMIPKKDGDNFMYSVKLRPFLLPGFLEKGNLDQHYYRAEVFLEHGGQHYDIMYYSKEQVIADIVNQYEKHLHYLHVHTWEDKYYIKDSL